MTLQTQASPAAQGTRHWLAVLGIGLLAGAIYSNTLDSPFVFDDRPHLIENPAIRLEDLGLQSLWRAAFESPAPARPIANLSLALNHYAGGTEPRGYHVVNILLHAATGALVYFFCLVTCRRAGRVAPGGALTEPQARMVALLAAALFTAHPIQTQAVTYTIQRMTTMAVMFYLAALLLYVAARSADGRRARYPLAAGSLLAWLLALGCKEIAASFPAVVLIYDWYLFGDLAPAWFRQRRGWLLFAFGISAALIVVVLGFDPLQRVLAGYELRDFTLGERLLTQLRVVVFYASLLAYPDPGRMNLLHQISTSQSLLQPISTLASAALLAIVLAVALLAARRHRLVSLCVLWFFVQLLIESSIIALELSFEHRLYLPSVGVALLAAWGMFRAVGQRPLPYAVVGCLLTGLLAFTAYARNETWRSRGSLWADVLAKNPNSPRAHTNAGWDLYEAGDHGAAIVHYRLALKHLAANPTHSPYRGSRTWFDLGLALAAQGNHEAAIRAYSSALELDPELNAARSRIGQSLLAMAQRVARDYLDRLQQRDFQGALEFWDPAGADHARSRLEISESLSHVQREFGPLESYELIDELNQRTSSGDRLLSMSYRVQYARQRLLERLVVRIPLGSGRRMAIVRHDRLPADQS